MEPETLAAAINLNSPDWRVRLEIARAIRRYAAAMMSQAIGRKPCRHCGKKFLLGPKPVGRGHRTDRIYCSDLCRYAAARHRKMERIHG